METTLSLREICTRARKAVERFCRYAADVIKGRWPEAEPAIMENSYWADLYNRNVLQKGASEQ